MKRTVIGILAHVDAGKTTCIESMLFLSGKIRKQGRVDHRDTVLDFDEQERDHGITIYSKETSYNWNDTEVYVIDPPGHVDFSSEMERSLSVLDLAVILINGQDGVQSHTETIWKCLQHYHVPCMIFVNKMDISHRTQEELLDDLKKHLSDNCIDFAAEDYMDHLAMVNEEMMNEYLDTTEIPEDMIREAIQRRECFPVLFGSALKNIGVKELMDTIVHWSMEKTYPEEFGARVYKISTDNAGTRLTHMKITGGVLKAKQRINEEEKADQIRLYNGAAFEMIDEASAGMIVTVKGLQSFEAGQGLGIEKDSEQPVLGAYMTYELLLPDGANQLALADTCRQLMEEDPQLEITTDDRTKKIQVRIMGTMQMEVLQKKIYDRSGIQVGFGTGKIIYMETLAEPTEGKGHFEPLRHYAEVHLHMEPGERGSGIVIDSACSTDVLSTGWQRSILSALERKHHRGVLTGYPLTDVHITLVTGRGHLKHTVGGDFRQAACRAVRQGLKKAECILLEPYYSFKLEVPAESLSRALFEMSERHAEVLVDDPGTGMMIITGKGPVRTLVNYQNDVIAYTKGRGKFTAVPCDYAPVEDQDRVVEEIGYDSEADLYNPTGSVFCAHGAGYYVPWDHCDDAMHIQLKQDVTTGGYRSTRYKVDENDLMRVFENASGRNRNENKKPKPKPKEEKPMKPVKRPDLKDCLIVDGYNMIYDWEDLKVTARESITIAREQLIDRIFSFQAYLGSKVIIVFDGYQVHGNAGSEVKRGEMTIIYTRTDQTADSYIEKAVHDLKGKYNITVASSDGLIQNSIFAHGASRMSARELQERIRLHDVMMADGIHA